MKRYQIYTFLCDCLSLDFHSEKLKGISRQLSSGQLNWEKIISLASNQFVLQTIYRIFKDHQLLGKIPEEAVAEMQRIYSLIKVRNSEMLELSLEINQILKKQDIIPVFSKGMGYLMQGLYKDPADRLMADVDLLLPYDSLSCAVKALEDNGYTHLKDLDPKQVSKLKHHPRIFKPGSLVSFEIHWEPIGTKYRTLLTEKMVMSEKMNAHQYPDCYTMSWEHAIQHNFIHAQLEHKAHKYAKVFIRNMYDLALLSKKENVANSLVALNEYQKQAASYIVLTEKTFNLNNLSNEHIKDKTSKFFLFKYEANLRSRIPNITIRLIERVYLSYIRKFFRLFFDKELRKVIFRHLSSKSWYKHHLNTYRKMFGKPQKY